MTIVAQEALDWLEGWLLEFSVVQPDERGDYAAEAAAEMRTALQHIDTIRAALPVTDGTATCQS